VAVTLRKFEGHGHNAWRNSERHTIGPPDAQSREFKTETIIESGVGVKQARGYNFMDASSLDKLTVGEYFNIILQWYRYATFSSANMPRRTERGSSCTVPRLPKPRRSHLLP